MAAVLPLRASSSTSWHRSVSRVMGVEWNSLPG